MTPIIQGYDLFTLSLPRNRNKNENKQLGPNQTSFCTAKKTINKTKRQPMEWEKMFSNDATDKVLISKIYKQFIQLNTKKKKNQKVGKRPKQTFLQRRHTDG